MGYIFIIVQNEQPRASTTVQDWYDVLSGTTGNVQSAEAFKDGAHIASWCNGLLSTSVTYDL